mmetsp:Transcript_106746/g.159656  ORF Transcript_106746/g.159656 Transcript_106746/m.159656 type:complete len:86 (-) Transcript_106746:52-309(-)
MAIDEEVKQKCISELEADHVECIVLGEGCEGGAKVELFVVSKMFDGVPLLKRHQMVNQMLSEELSSNKIHALTIKAKTPAQYSKN